jgi:hypothetical protein
MDSRDKPKYQGLGWEPPNDKPVHPARYDAEFSADFSAKPVHPARYDADFSVDLGADPRDRRGGS